MTAKDLQKPVTFYLDESAYDWLTQDAARLQISRSAYLRNIVDWWRTQRETEGGEGQATILAQVAEGQKLTMSSAASEVILAQERITALEEQITRP